MEEIPFPNRRLEPLPQDIDYAISLLGWSTNKPAPTEKEGRAALARILYAQSRAMREGRDNVPGAIAVTFLLGILFESEDPLRRVVFKNANKRASRSWDIAAAMHDLYKKEGYDKAAEKAAEMLGLSDRHVKRAYAKHKDELR
jgi:hypothetical protein